MKAKIIAALLALMLLSSCAAPETVPEASPEVTPISETPPITETMPEPEISAGYTVQTDYSGLAPYVREPEIYTRLSGEPMPELIPSDSYGTLVPYAGARVYGSSYAYNSTKYGLATLGGMMVTDAVYTRASLERSPDGVNSVYALRVPKPDDSGDGHTALNDSLIACAVDGSWILESKYADIIAQDSVIMAKRISEYPATKASFDIDVYDYTGRLLYNVLDLPCADKLDNERWYEFMRPVTGDYLMAALTAGGVAYIHLPTGKVTYTGFDEALQFSDGLSAVRIGELWGYVDETLDLVIAPQFSAAGDFINGQAVILSADPTSSSVIDKQGNRLFSISGDGRLYAEYNGEAYILHDDKGRTVAYYTPDFVEIPAEIDGEDVWYAGEGYFWYGSTDGVLLIAPDGTRRELPGVWYISSIASGLVTYTSGDSTSYESGVMTVYGETVIPLQDGYVYRTQGTDLLFAYAQTGGTFFNLDGSVFAHFGGSSVITEAFGLIGIETNLEFYYLDENSDVVFRVSLMDSLSD